MRYSIKAKYACPYTFVSLLTNLSPGNMDYSNTIKSFFILFGFLIGGLTIVTCVYRQSTNRMQSDNHQYSKLTNNSTLENDAQFLIDAVEINMIEMQLGQLAQKKAMSIDVRDLGRRMEAEHIESYKQLTSLAKQKLVALPSQAPKKGQVAYARLKGKSDVRFDKAYCNMMVAEHKQAIALFEKATTSASDPEIKAWARASIPSLKSYLGFALLCQRMCEEL